MKNKMFWRIIFIFAISGIAFNLWSNLYNTYVPIFLQAGNTTFDAKLSTPSMGFGASPSLTSIIMSLDNISGFLFIPLMGLLSDRAKKRKPFITYSIPVFAVAIAAMPFVMRLINPQTNGHFNLLIFPFCLLTICILLTLAAQLFDGIPSSALIFDIIPSEERSKYGGISGLIGMVVGVGLMAISGVLYTLDRVLPFLIVSGLLMIYWVLFVVLIKEPEHQQSETSEEKNAQGLRSLFVGLKKFSAQEKKDLLFTCLTAFGLFATSNILLTFASSYAVSVLGLAESQTIQVLMAFQVGMILLVVPGGFLPSKIGRKNTMKIGGAMMIITMVILFFIKNTTGVMICLGLLGMGWILINVNIMPFYTDIVDSNKKLGTVLGLTAVGSQLGAILMVPLVGWLIETFNNNYNLIWPITIIVFIFGMGMFFLVKGGEIHPTVKKEIEEKTS